MPNPIVNQLSLGNTVYDISLPSTDEVRTNTVYNILSASSVAGSASSPYLSVRWYVASVGTEAITTPYDGMKILVKIPRVGVGTAGVVLSINGNTAADYHPVAYNINTVLTSHYAVNSYKMFVYDASATMTCYITSGTSTTITGVWKGESNYDSNTTTAYGTLSYYFRPYVGANRLSSYKIVALDKDNRVVPITTEQYMGTYSTSTTYSINDIVVSSSKYYKSLANSNKNKAVTNTSYWTQITMPSTFTPTTVAFKPNKLYFYNTTASIASGAVIGGQTLTEIGYSTAVCQYTFWASIASYKMIYLQGTYNTTTGLFTLDTGSNYYKLVPNNTANITLSSYFTSGKDYILVGCTYSSANYFQLFMVNTMYRFDGTNLVPYDTYRANTIAASIPTVDYPVTNVKLNGTSVVTNKVAEISATPTSVLPADSGEVKTKFRCAVKNYTGGASTAWYYKLCTLPASTSGNYASVLISGRLGGWTSNNLSSIYALSWNRDSTGFALIDIGGAGTMANIFARCDLVMYTNTNSTVTIYAKVTEYFTFDLDIELFQSTAVMEFDGTYTTSPAGTLAASASTSTSRLQLEQGVLKVNGVGVALLTGDQTFSNGTKTFKGDICMHASSGTTSKVQFKIGAYADNKSWGIYNTNGSLYFDKYNNSAWTNVAYLTSDVNSTPKLTVAGNIEAQNLGDQVTYSYSGGTLTITSL